MSLKFEYRARVSRRRRRRVRGRPGYPPVPIRGGSPIPLRVFRRVFVIGFSRRFLLSGFSRRVRDRGTARRPSHFPIPPVVPWNRARAGIRGRALSAHLRVATRRRRTALDARRRPGVALRNTRAPCGGRVRRRPRDPPVLFQRRRRRFHRIRGSRVPRGRHLGGWRRRSSRLFPSRSRRFRDPLFPDHHVLRFSLEQTLPGRRPSLRQVLPPVRVEIRELVRVLEHQHRDQSERANHPQRPPAPRPPARLRALRGQHHWRLGRPRRHRRTPTRAPAALRRRVSWKRSGSRNDGRRLSKQSSYALLQVLTRSRFRSRRQFPTAGGTRSSGRTRTAGTSSRTGPPACARTARSTARPIPG